MFANERPPLPDCNDHRLSNCGTLSERNENDETVVGVITKKCPSDSTHVQNEVILIQKDRDQDDHVYDDNHEER